MAGGISLRSRKSGSVRTKWFVYVLHTAHHIAMNYFYSSLKAFHHYTPACKAQWLEDQASMSEVICLNPMRVAGYTVFLKEWVNTCDDTQKHGQDI